MFLISFNVSASDEWSDTWELNYEEEIKEPINETAPPEEPPVDPPEEPIYDPQYDPQAFSPYETLNFSTKGNFTEQTEFTAISTLNFSSKLSTTSQTSNPITFYSPNPANASTDVSTSTTIWNVTIEDPEGNDFNWSIMTSPYVGQNSSNYSSNGSKQVTLSGLSYSTTYTIWVNGTDDNGSATTNKSTYTFTTQSSSNFTAYDTLSFGCKVDIQGEDTITFTRISQSPDNIRMNQSNNSVYITYNLTTNSTDINESSLFIATVLNHTHTGCLNSTWTLPASIMHPNRCEAKNRDCYGTGYWWESLFNNTGTKSNELGYCSEWGVYNETLAGNFTINSQGSNWTNFSFDPRIYMLFSRIEFVDLYDIRQEVKTSQYYNVFSNNMVKVNFNMTDTCYWDNNQYNASLYTLYFYDTYTGTPSHGLLVYFANNSYDLDRGKPQVSSYCELIKTIDYTDPYEFTSHNSSYHNATFSVDANGYVGAVKMTSNYSIIFVKKMGSSGQKFEMRYADNNYTHGDHWHEFNQSETTQITTNYGKDWTFTNGTVDCFMTYVNLNETDQIMYKVYAQKTTESTGCGNWSTTQKDLIDASNYAPSNPDIISQDTNETYVQGSTVNITYGWLGDPNFDTCWLNITCHNDSHEIVEYVNNRSITEAEAVVNNTWWYMWDTSNMPIGGPYHINITATDPYGLSADAESNGTFNISFAASIICNGSSDVEETNATVYAYISDNNSLNTYAYFLLKAEINDFITPDVNVSAGLQPQDVNISANALPLLNGTFYYLKAASNNSLGWNESANSCTLITKPQPATGVTITHISGGFNISWTHGDGYNDSYLVNKTGSVPANRGDGTNIYFGSNNWYHHTGLTPGTTYYYRVWEQANWSNSLYYSWSDGDYNNSYQYQGEQPVFYSPNPANESTGVAVITTTWNITIKSPRGETFNWSIESSPFIGNASGGFDINGSKSIDITSNLSHYMNYTIFVNATETVNDNESKATYWFTTQINQPPVFYSPNPANETLYVPISLASWNITIRDPDGPVFNWTIETSPDIGNNSDLSYTATNGSKSVSTSGLVNHTQYTVFVNATDGYNETKAAYWFNSTTTNFTAYDILTFGSKLDVQGTDPVLSNEAPTNTSYENDLYPWLNITIDDPQLDDMNVSWYSNYSGTWQAIQFNATCTSGTTQRHRAVWANTSYTTYYWNVSVNDTDGHWTNESYFFTTANYSWGNWSTWWQFNYSCCVGGNFTATMYNASCINLTWDTCPSADKNILVRNATGYASYPINQTNGTVLYNGTNESYNDTNLGADTYYYYTLWGWNETEGNYSILNETAYAATEGPIDVCCPDPINSETSVWRPPEDNISIRINGTGLNVYIYWVNLTPVTNTTTLLKSWTGVGTNRWNVTDLIANFSMSEFLWGNTTYNWTVNVTDGSTWVNRSYNYTTNATVSVTYTRDARYDVDNDGAIYVFDLNAVWAARYVSGVVGTVYNGIYDVDYDNKVYMFDLNSVWANKTT